MTLQLTALRPGDKLRATAPWADCWQPGDTFDVYLVNGEPTINCWSLGNRRGRHMLIEENMPYFELVSSGPSAP